MRLDGVYDNKKVRSDEIRSLHLTSPPYRGAQVNYRSAGPGLCFPKGLCPAITVHLTDTQTARAPWTPIKDTPGWGDVRPSFKPRRTSEKHFQHLKLSLSSSSSCVKLQFLHSPCWWRCWAALRPQTDTPCTEWSCAAESSSGRSSSPVEARAGGDLWMSQVRVRFEDIFVHFILLFTC